VHRGAAAALRLFLEYLEQEAIIPPARSSSPTPIALLQARYEAHLHHDRGCRRSPGPDIGLSSAGFCGSGSARAHSTRRRLPSRTSHATSASRFRQARRPVRSSVRRHCARSSGFCGTPGRPRAI
jgi:hypothetical protein